MSNGLTNTVGAKTIDTIYTFATDSNISEPANRVTYLDTAFDFTVTDAQELYKEHNRPCVVSRETGLPEYYLKWDDFNTTTDNTTAVLDGTDGDVMIEMDTVWWKAWKDGTKDMFSWTYEEPVGVPGFKPWGHYKGIDKVNDHFYAAVFKFNTNSSHATTGFGSINTDVNPQVSINMTTFESSCKLGNGVVTTGSSNTSDYTIMRAPQYTLIRKMHDFVAKNTNSQAYFGNGWVSKSAAAAHNLGFDATHMMRATTPDTSGGAGVNSLGFNNLWGNVYEFCGQTAYANRKFKCNYLNDTDSYVANISAANYSTLPASWYESNTLSLPMSNAWLYPKDDLNEGPFAAFPGPTEGGSSSSYYCDGCYVPSSGANQCVLFSGHWNYSAVAGVRCANLDTALLYSYSHVGARLLIIP